MGMDDVRRIVKQPLQATLASHLRVITPMLARLNTTVLCASGDARFITSDTPCTWFDPEAYKRTPFYRSPALMYPSLEITMPISPDQCLLLSHRHDLNRYVEVGDDLVDELNRRARGYADVEFIAQTSAAKAIWYDEGRPPDDGRAGPSRDEEV
jgi:hypothetical protein